VSFGYIKRTFVRNNDELEYIALTNKLFSIISAIRLNKLKICGRVI